MRARCPRLWIARLLAGLALLLCAGPSYATQRFCLVICDGLTIDSLRSPSLPHLRSLASMGQVGLINTAVAGARTDIASVLTIATGALTPSEPTDAEILRANTPVNRVTAAVEYRRRTGIQVGERADTVLHLSIASLKRRGITNLIVGARLPEGEVAAGGGVRSGLIAMDGDGRCDAGPAAQDARVLALWATQTRNSVTIDLGHDEGALDAFLADYQQNDRVVMVVSSRPPLDQMGLWQKRLPLAVMAWPSAPKGLLTSATTRTPGLIANIDIAPTILQLCGKPLPATMTGHPITYSATSDANAALVRMDRIVCANARAIVPEFTVLGVMVAVIVFGGIAVIPRRRGAGRWFAFGLLHMANMPLAMLLVVPLNCATAHQLTVYTLGIMLGLAAIETAISCLSHRATPLLVMAVFTTAAILIDALTGQALIKYALFSSYQLQGIRFYGIGNEYMGVLIGQVLLLAYYAHMSPKQAASLFAITTFILCFPLFGAKAGGFITCFVAFGLAVTSLRGGEVRLRNALRWCVGGAVSAFGLAVAERFVPGAAPSHMGGAIQGAHELGLSYLGDIVIRKVVMNARIFVTPGALSAYLGVAVLWIVVRATLRSPVTRMLQRTPELSRAIPVVGYGALAAFAFNDSGTVAGIFVAAAFIVAAIYQMFSQPEAFDPGDHGV